MKLFNSCCISFPAPQHTKVAIVIVNAAIEACQTGCDLFSNFFTIVMVIEMDTSDNNMIRLFDCIGRTIDKNGELNVEE